MGRIQVLYVEDDEDWRAGLAAFFAGHEEIELFACVSTIQEGFGFLVRHSVDIVILDIILDNSGLTGLDAALDMRVMSRAASNSGLTGLDAALDMRVMFPGVKVIMLSSLDQSDEIFNEAFLNGAYDYIYKNDFEQLPDVIRAAMRNQTSKYGERLRKLVFEKKKSLLTDGDGELLWLILEGRSQTQIAGELSVSLAAVKKHVGRVKKKFEWERSSLELAEKCKKWDLLDP